jgi:glycosyltransferase involved in cell wall biosynthesis
MIIVVAAFPATENQKDGMVQRVLHIDSLIKPYPRVYLDISFRRFFRKNCYIDGRATVYRLNFFVHALLIARLLRQAKLIYIHSAYNALKSILFPSKAYVVFDAHGIVPEELFQEKKKLASWIYSLAERLVIKRCNTLICVSRSMLTYLKSKYVNNIKCDEIILPILPKVDDTITSDQILSAIRDDRAVIYAGGMQAWQNVDKMLDAAKAQPNLKYTFLTGEIQRFTSLLRENSMVNVICLSVKPEEVKEYYLKHEYGFILRDEVLVNLVACPTKLVEYLYWGVIPIIITPRVGDFDAESLSGVTLDQFIAGNLPNETARSLMRKQNYRAVKLIIDAASAYQNQLQALLIKFS